MSDQKKEDGTEPKKVFFITSNQKKLDNFIRYKIVENRGVAKLRAGNSGSSDDNKAEIREEKTYKHQLFSLFINSMEIDPKTLNDKDKNDKGKYKASLTMKYNKCDFVKDINFLKFKNNFIYDFEFSPYIGWTKRLEPPPQINFTKLEQLKIYINYVKNILKKKQKDRIYKDLITESQAITLGKKTDLDFYLEIFKNCYTEFEIKLHLKNLKLENLIISNNIEFKNYSKLFDTIENKPQIIIQHCTPKEDKNKYYLALYTLLLFTRFLFEREKAYKMIEKKNLWEYFIKILPDKANFFPKFKLPEELIKNMFNQKLTVNIIVGTLSFCGSIENILELILEKIDIIANCCIKEKKEIILSTLENPKKTDDIEKIIEKIEKIIEYETTKGNIFISFDKNFWEYYVQFNDDIEKLSLINKAIILCLNIDKTLKVDFKDLNIKLINKIHSNGLDAINKGILKNEKLLDFINIDKYFSDNKYSNKIYRPMSIVKGLDFNTITENFYERWKNSNIFNIYSFASFDFKCNIISQIKEIKDFGKLLKLFNYKDKNIFNIQLFSKLRETFKNIMKTYKVETCPNFIEDIAYFIYIIDYQKAEIAQFMKNTIEKYIPAIQTITNIYIYLAKNYKDLSQPAINTITDFLTKNNDQLNAKGILSILDINSSKIIESLLNKIQNLTIKEEELFSPEKEVESFILLEGIQKIGLFKKFDFLSKPKYLIDILQEQHKISEKIEKGEINYDIFRKLYIKKEIREIFKNKLGILFFNNKEDVEKYMKILTNDFNNIIKVLGYINKLQSMLQEFFINEHKNDIIKVENLGYLIKSGNMKEIEKPNVKNIIEDIHNIFTQEEFDKKIKLKESIFFVQLFRARKMNNINFNKESEIFERTEKEFKELKKLFTMKNWMNDIPETIIKECFKSLKNEKKKKLKDELNNLIKIFQIEGLDDAKLETLEAAIIIYNQKEEIFLTANSCINLIDELEAEKTDFYDNLNKIINDITNLTIDKIQSYGETLEKYGLNVLNKKQEDMDYLDILHCTFNVKGSIKFIAKLNEEDIRNLQELVNMSDDTFVTNNEIQDMIKCSNFINNLGEIKGKKNDKELIQDFIKEVPKIKGIAAHFSNYTNNAAQIQELFSRGLDKTQATRKQIEDLMKGSKFTFMIENNNAPYLKFEGEFTNVENNEQQKKMNYDNIMELRERAMLTRKLGDDKSMDEKNLFELYKLFAERVSQIERINYFLKKLGEKGYSENIKVVIKINNNNPIFSIDNKIVNNYESCWKYLDKIFMQITEVQTKYYKNEELLRYVYGRQFNLLNSCLKKEINNELVPFLKFLTNDQIDSSEKLKVLDFDYDYKINEDKYICLCENIKKFLLGFLEKNKLNLETIYKYNMIKDEYKKDFVGLYTYLLEDDKIGEVQKGIEEHILNWFNFLTGHPPMAQTVLLCNEETTSEEITAFMYRAFLCQYQVFFMIGKIELLSSQKRQTLIKLINLLFSNKGKDMKSCIAFAYSKKDDSLVKALEGISGHKFLIHDSMKKNQDNLYEENVEIIFSDKAGVGKSTYIQLKVKEQKKKYIHFPFGGEFSRKDAINRLKKIQNQLTNEENSIIHLDLDDSKQTELMKDFLYSFLITKLYGQNENLFYLSKKVKIIIEIPCGFIDFFQKYPLLSMFKNKTEMKITNLPPLIIQKELDSNIQIVCNYLKLINSGNLCEKDLIINNISLSKEELQSYWEDTDNNANIDDYIVNAKSLNKDECENLIKDLLKKELGIEYPTYYQIKSFINVLSGQLKKFSMIHTFTVPYLTRMEEVFKGKKFKQLRGIMIKSFIKNTIHFTQGAFDKILTAQKETYKVKIMQGNYDINKQEEAAIKALSEPNDIISCDKISPALVFFHEGEGQDYSIITGANPNKDEYNDLLELKRSFAKVENYLNQKKENKREIPKELKQYNKFKHPQFLEEIKQILSIKNPVYIKDKENEKLPNIKKLKSIEEIVGDYIFTSDNFIKMILILLRIRENIPVIMMGETGCGKTSLIRKLSELINNGKSMMEILNIHAGITDEEIVKFLFDKKEIEGVWYDSIIEKAKKLGEEEENKYQTYKKLGQKYFKKKLWVFLDEINTCNCMGLICELMTKHTCQGKELPENIFFIGACNPYRYGRKGVDNYALKIEGAKEKNLVYTVNPLPFSLLNFVFNFGNLTPDDEKSYINNMVVNPIENFFWKEVELANKDNKDFDRNNKEKYFSKENYELCEELKKLSRDAIIEAQNYVRDNNDVSSVSLREIRRFSIFYEFFVEYFRKNKKISENMDQKENYDKFDTFYQNLNNKEIYINSIKLSIYLCYYMRLNNKECRQELAKKMNKIFGDNFILIPEHEQNYVVKNIKLKMGIAKNEALLENLFTLFACVNAKVPLFIVGKPGCSKSLSVQLLFGAMKGDSSDNPLFKSLPRLVINSFQGSLGSTSKGVLNIFKKARKFLKNYNNNLYKMISMIYFDEMGLAEHSPNNPLKVIHSELEYDLNEGVKKIAFVGISNWVLDASKMNRGLFLSIPQPDKDDLKKTAITIAESYNKKLAEDNKDLFLNLADSYYEYKRILHEEHTKNEDFHGSRDFYHLIKTAMRQLLQKKEEDNDFNIDENVKQDIGIKSIERNFAGLEFNAGEVGSTTSLEIMKKQFQKKYPNCDVLKNYKVIKTICENIKDKDSRYLLLVSKSSISNYLLNSILSSDEFKKDFKKELSFYIGSGFTKDVHSEGYGLKILNKIQVQMEQNKILLLTDLEAVYPSLYDLFNQNFTVVSKKNYARIAMGSTNNTFSLVNDGFKCIVIYDENSIEDAMAPFLNRFEKHIISFEYLLSEAYIKEANIIYNMIQDFANPNLQDNNNINLKYSLDNLLINCDKEEIQGIIYSKIKEYEKINKKLLVQELQDLVLEKIVLTLPQDIILLLKYSGFEQKYPNVVDKIIDFYKKGEHSNFLKFLQKMSNYKNVIYTFTSIVTSLLPKISDEFETELLGKINTSNIKEIQISSFTTENEFESELDQVYKGENNNIKIIILKLNPYETGIMNYIKFFVENYIKENSHLEENNKKVCIFSVHMDRIFESDIKNPKKKGYLRKNKLKETISHLSDFYHIFIDDLNGEDYTIVDIMKYNSEELFCKCLDIDKEFMDNIYDIFSYFNYNFTIEIEGIDKNNYPKKVINFLKNNKELTKLLIKCILKKPIDNIDIGNILKKNEIFTSKDIGIVSVVQKYLSKLFIDNLIKLIFELEKDNFLSPFIFNNHKGVQEIKGENEIKKEENEIKKEENEIKKEENEKKEKKMEEKENKELKQQEKNYYLNNQLVKILIEIYLENVNFSLAAVKKNMKNNKLSLLLGLRLPGIYITLKNIIKYIKSEIKVKYFNAEREIIDLRDEEGFDFGKFLDKYKNRIKNQRKHTEIEIIKNKIFEKFDSLDDKYQIDSKEFYDLLMNDCYLIFLSENLVNINDIYKNIEEYKNILKLMLFERFNNGEEGEEINPIKAMANKIVWLETYSQYISILLNIYREISIYDKNCFNKINKIIKNREIILEVDEKRNPIHTIELKSPFYFVTESLLRISIDINIFNKLNGQDFYEYINILKNISKDSLTINEDLSLYSREIYTIQEFLEIEKGLNNINKSNEENIIKVLSILLDLSNINNEFECSNKIANLSINIKQLYEFLLNNLGDTRNFRELIMGIFVGELKKIKDDNYRKTLVEIILNNINLIVFSHTFMSIILNGFLSYEPAFIDKNIINFQRSKSPLLELINNSNNDLLNEILLNIFESKINLYFESIPYIPKCDKHLYPKYFEYMENNNNINPTFILSDESLILFKNSVNILETIYKNKKEGNKDINNDLICGLYSIAYIKIYLFKYAYFSHFNNQQFIYYKEVLDTIIGDAKTEVRKMIKIYVFKIFFYLLGNYQEFVGYNYKNHQILFFDDLKDRFNENKEAMLSFYMLPNAEENKFEIFKENMDKFEKYKFSDFGKPIKDFVDLIINYGIDYYYIISTDIILSNLALVNYVKDSNDYNKYSSFTKNIFSDQKINISEITKKLFFLYSNDETFNNTMKKKIVDEQNLKEINIKQFEILLYSLRFCLQTSNCENPEQFLYSELLTPNCEDKLKENYIPGNNIIDNYYLLNYFLLKKHLDTRASNIGAYVCSCGFYYDIDECGFPPFPPIENRMICPKCKNCKNNPYCKDCPNCPNCPNCGKPIGYRKLPPNIKGYHGFAHVPGHYRIFKDAEQKKFEMSRYFDKNGKRDTDESIPNMLLEDYKTKKIDPIMKDEKCGINKVNRVIFDDINQKVRKLSPIGYRFLNFILYSHLFYANCLRFIRNEDMSKYVCDGMNCIEMIEKDWNLLQDLLQSKGIQRIQIFMNQIFDKISEKLKNYKVKKALEEREKFEEEIEQILEESYKEYNNYSKIYNINNEQLLELDKYSMKSLVLETNDVTSYDENDYPFYKYFLMTTYPTKEAFIIELKKVPQYETKYPLLTNYLREDNSEKFLIKYLPEFNEFSNFMIDYYSYNISRKDASDRIMCEEDLYKNDQYKFKQKFKSFMQLWKKLKDHAKKYGCGKDMDSIEWNDKLPVAYFLIDNGDIGKGMYFAAAYQKIIEWQNNFLDSIIEASKQSGILHHFVKNMENTIDIQKAKKNEALCFDIVNENFNRYIYENSKRNIFRENNTINYMNYKQFIYDFDEIEKILGEIILPGKVKFNSHEKLRFVTFCFEGFRGDKSSVLTDFTDKYKQVPLNFENKQIFYDFIIKKYNGKTTELSNILFSIQLLMYYFTQEIQREKDEIKTLIENLPDYVILSKECIHFFEEIKLQIKLEDLVGVYSFFELLCFKPIINNLQDYYKKPIDENIKKNILNSFEGEDKKFKLITKKNLASACRKFISRYLVSTRNDTEYFEEMDLSFNLTRYEFWPPEYFDDEDIFNNEINLLKNEKITNGQCFELYNLLGGDETDEMKGIQIKIEEEKDINDFDDSDEEGEERLVQREDRHQRRNFL